MKSTAKLPKDSHSRVIGAEARQIVHSSFDVEHWEYHETTGTDHGLDCIIELVENEEWGNKKIEGQIKGTKCPYILKNKKMISFPFDIKTINYGLGSSITFVLFLVDVITKTVYYFHCKIILLLTQYCLIALRNEFTYSM